jgi:hypothetical protein
MSKVKIELLGLEALKAAVVRCPDVVRHHMGDVVHRTTFGTAQRARAFANAIRDTGALAEAIDAPPVRGLSGRVVVKSGIIRGRRPDIYWRFNEYGTVRLPARPLFRASAEAESVTFVQRLHGIVPKIERDFTASRFI